MATGLHCRRVMPERWSALRLAEAAGLDRPARAVVFYTNLVAWICLLYTSDAADE